MKLEETLMSNKLRTEASSKALPFVSGIIWETKVYSLNNPSSITQPMSNAVSDFETEKIICGVVEEQ